MKKYTLKLVVEGYEFKYESDDMNQIVDAMYTAASELNIDVEVDREQAIKAIVEMGTGGKVKFMVRDRIEKREGRKSNETGCNKDI